MVGNRPTEDTTGETIGGSDRGGDLHEPMRREFHTMRYQLADEESQLSFVEADRSPVFEALSAVESLQPNHEPLTAGALLQLEGTQTHSVLVEAVEHMSVGFILFDSEDRLVLCNAKYKELYSHIAHLLVQGANYHDIADAAFANAEEGARQVRLDGWVRHPGDAEGEAHRIGLPNGSWVETQDEELSDGSRFSVRTDVTEAREDERALLDEANALRGKLDRAHDLAREIDGLFSSVCRDSAVLEKQVSNIGGLRALCQVIEHSAVRGRGLATRLVEAIGLGNDEGTETIPKMPRLKMPADDQGTSRHGKESSGVSIITVISDGVMKWGDRVFRCELGAAGVTASKREGDGATPIGCFAIRQVLYRPDREKPPQTLFPVAPITPESAWCVDPGEQYYNQQVTLPYEGESEPLWREDGSYDIVVVLGYNDRPIVPACGSAIFLYVTDPDYSATKGGITLSREDLLTLLRDCPGDVRVCVVG